MGVESSDWELPVVVVHESRGPLTIKTLGPGRKPTEEPFSRVSATRPGRLRYIVSALTRYPHLAASPVRDPRPDVLDQDRVFGGTGFVCVPFAGPLERGWAAWAFESEALRDTFVRRHKKARTVPDLSYITRLTSQRDDLARDQLESVAKRLGVNLA